MKKKETFEEYCKRITGLSGDALQKWANEGAKEWIKETESKPVDTTPGQPASTEPDPKK